MRRAIITGGSSGLGLAAAQLLRERGDHVVILDVQEPESEWPFVRTDVSADDSVRNAVKGAADLLGGIDIVINSAAISAIGDVSANSDEQWATTLNVNVTGIARICRAAEPYLRQGSAPVIVNVASVASITGLAQRVLYSATKGAVLAMTLAMATDYRAAGIRVNAVAPGTADTPWVARLLATAEDPQAARTALEARQPIGRLISADEVALAIGYLTDARSGSTTGTVLTVDGGLHSLLPPR